MPLKNRDAGLESTLFQCIRFLHERNSWWNLGKSNTLKRGYSHSEEKKKNSKQRQNLGVVSVDHMTRFSIDKARQKRPSYTWLFLQAHLNYQK